MQVLIDTNVILDVLLNRAYFVQDAVKILRLACDDLYEYVSASAITDIYYIATKEIKDKAKVRDLLKRLIKVVHVADVSERAIVSALDSNWKDFEDSVQNAVAEYNAFDAIVTRNPADFKGSVLPVYSPKDFLERIVKEYG